MAEVFDNDLNAPWNNEEESECAFCEKPCSKRYCSRECANEDNR